MRVGRSVRDLPPADVALAAGLLVLKVVLVLTSTLMSPGSLLLALVSSVGLTVPLAFRRRAPLVVALTVAAFLAVDDLVAGWDGAVISFDCSIIAAYSAGAHARQRHAVIALAALVAANVVDAVGAPGNLMGNLALGVVVFSVVPWLVGQALRRERGRTAQLQELAAALEAEREQRAQAAVAAERSRIARELHDVLAHAISVVAVQADAATRWLARDPARAAAPLELIQSTSRGALTEMRQLVGLLRLDEEKAPMSPQAGLGDLDRLVDEVRRAGLPVTLEVIGDVHDLPTTVDLAAYRIVQEALTNVRKHAGQARADVAIRHERDQLVLVVRDDGDGPVNGSGGHGLLGIRERVELLGGDLECGADAATGGFVLSARLPVTEES